jgi:hypothetical protein
MTAATKKTYEQPKLVAFGSVRNLTGGSLDVGTDTGFPAGMNLRSDRRAKENIVQVGTHAAGFGLYLFDYTAEFRDAGEGRQFGVMADEVAAVLPEAVTIDATGYAMVNYDMLGITRH